MIVISKIFQHAFLTAIYIKVFVISEFNSDLHETFTESLELV